MASGTSARISVPRMSPDFTESLPPTSRSRSRIPTKPIPAAGLVSSGSKPLPASVIRRLIPFAFVPSSTCALRGCPSSHYSPANRHKGEPKSCDKSGLRMLCIRLPSRLLPRSVETSIRLKENTNYHQRLLKAELYGVWPIRALFLSPDKFPTGSSTRHCCRKRCACELSNMDINRPAAISR
jgi:hypothetical protein